MTVFGMSDRGKFMVVPVDTKDGEGIQVSIPSGGSSNGSTLIGASSLVTSFGAEQRENFSVSQCLNGGIYMYTFGHDPANSQFTLGVTSFINTCSGKVADDLAAAIKAYQAGRVSQSHNVASLSIGTASLRGYLVGHSIRAADTALGLVESSYTFVALDPQGGGK